MTLPVPENPRIIALFDVDGTLTIPRGEITTEMFDCLKELRTKITIGTVGGSDLPKQEEQLGEGVVHNFHWNFSQNGLVAYHNGVLLDTNSIAKHLGEDNVKRVVNWVMRYMADLDLPVKVRTCQLCINPSWDVFLRVWFDSMVGFHKAKCVALGCCRV